MLTGCLSVAPNVGYYRTTTHEYNLIFQMKTKVQKIEGSPIPSNGLSLSKIEELSKHTADFHRVESLVYQMKAYKFIVRNNLAANPIKSYLLLHPFSPLEINKDVFQYSSLLVITCNNLVSTCDKSEEC